MKAFVPRTFRTGGIVDVEDINANLLHLQRDISRSQQRRYTYCSVVIPISGFDSADTAAQNTVPFTATGQEVEIIAAELSIYATAGATWTATTTDENGVTATVSVATAGATTEATASVVTRLRLDGSNRSRWALTASSASSIVAGSLTLSLRIDRWSQGGTRTGYTASLLDAATATTADAINTELANADLAVDDDELRVDDYRCMCIAIVGALSARTISIPSGAMVADSMIPVIVATAATTWTVTDGTNTRIVTGTGTSNIVEGASQSLVTKADDPTDGSDDLVLTLTPSALVSRCYLFLWWK